MKGDLLREQYMQCLCVERGYRFVEVERTNQRGDGLACFVSPRLELVDSRCVHRMLLTEVLGTGSWGGEGGGGVEEKKALASSPSEKLEGSCDSLTVPLYALVAYPCHDGMCVYVEHRPILFLDCGDRVGVMVRVRVRDSQASNEACEALVVRGQKK